MIDFVRHCGVKFQGGKKNRRHIHRSLTENYTARLIPFRHPITILHYADKRIVNITNVYIESNNLQLELIRYFKNVDFIHVYVCEAKDSMQYRSPIGHQIISGCFEHKPLCSLSFLNDNMGLSTSLRF